MKTHLVLGGNGFLGRHVALALARRGDRVIVVGRHPFSDKFSPVECVICDLACAQCAELDRLVAKVDVFHHFAWSKIPKTANIDPLNDMVDNVGMTIRLLEAIKRRGGGRVVFASSGGTVYGKLKCIPAPESHPLNPISAYGVSKVAAEKYFGFYADMYGLDVRIARISNPYGFGQDTKKGQGAVTIFHNKIINRMPVEIWGDGTSIRDYIYISDLVDAVLALTDISCPANNEQVVLNIGSGIGTSLNNVLKILSEELSLPVQVNYKPARPFDIPANILDISLAASLLLWSPKVRLREGIRQMIGSV